jgi:2-dehydro-3-deoxy-D-arabinonate dehydratase
MTELTLGPTDDQSQPMRIFRTTTGIALEHDSRWFALPDTSWDALVNRDDLHDYLLSATEYTEARSAPADADLFPPIESQEVWAAGVTYYRSRTARMEEAKTAGGGDFYDRVYAADRPELFFKATPHRVRGHGQTVRIRSDASWNVPEPELTLAVTSSGRIVGYTIGNDMSSRDIEGENPLYLPQAKVYDSSCGLGPGLLVTSEPLGKATEIALRIGRSGDTVFTGTTTLAAMKRVPEELVRYLYRDNHFPAGSLLLTGTGIVPPDDFTLASGDEVTITIEPIGTLVNHVL